MVTNGGPHPPEKWAAVTTKAIADLIVIEPSAPTQAVIDKREFEAALFNKLVDLHEHVQTTERMMLANHAERHRHVPIDPKDYASSAVRSIMEIVDKTRFAAHFAKPEVQAFLHNVTGQHFANSAHIERSWHADRNRKS